MTAQLWNVHYRYLKTMFNECTAGNQHFRVIAESEVEALAKGDKLFAAISEYHAQLVDSKREVYDNGDPHGYGTLSDLERKASLNEGYTISLTPPKLDGLDAAKFDLETEVENDGKNIRIKYIPRPK